MTEQSSIHNESVPSTLQTPTQLHLKGPQIYARGSSLEPIHPR